jgi:predicted lactoylglutathione lyase
MAEKIFINLPVHDLERSKAFYLNLGFSQNPTFSDETAVCMVISDNIYTMLLTHEKFLQFTPKAIADAEKTTEVLNALQVDQKDLVNKMADAAISAGGTEARPIQDHGFMYGRSFNDPDGHIWEVFWMDTSMLPT